MKKILLTLLLALPFCMVAKAQDFRVGITGGYNLSSPSGYKSQSGFHVGVKGELGLPIVTKGLYMDFGLMLSSHGWKSPGYYYDGNYNPSAGEKPDKPSSGYTSATIRSTPGHPAQARECLSCVVPSCCCLPCCSATRR